METKVGEVRIAEAERGREKGRERKETRREGIEERKIKPKKKNTIKVNKVAKQWEIWDEDEKLVKPEEEAKKLVL